MKLTSSEYWPEYFTDCRSVDEALNLNSDHWPRFARQLDREVFEHIPANSDTVLVPHYVFDTCPRHLKLEFIAKQARCSFAEAKNLADALHILDADEKLAKEVCRWARVRGVEATLRYLHKFLVAIAEAETPDPDPQNDEEPLVGDQRIKAVEEMTDNELRKELKNRGVFGYERMLRHELEREVTKLDQAEQDAEYQEPDTIAYHRLGDDGSPDWLSQQPHWFQKLIADVRACPDLDRLKRYGKAVFASNLTGDRASVFWSYYNARKSFLQSKLHLSAKAQACISRLQQLETPQQIARAGKALYRLPKATFRPHEWTAIWATYRNVKAQRRHAA